MCRNKSHGGRRCQPSVTVNARRTVAQRLKRHQLAGDRAAAEVDARVLAGLDAARAHYGDVVAPMVMNLPESVHAVFAALRGSGFRPLVVGGSVRDALSDGRPPKDVDVEVYGATIDNTLTVLRRAGYRVDEVGKSFGVLKVMLRDGTDLDVSVPRRDNHVGAGHRGFTVETDTSMTAAEAAARRDFTLNAMGFDPEFGVLVDPYGGKTDLEAGVLRATSDAFGEDPLRVLRGFQFAARYGMNMDPDTTHVCRVLLGRASELPVERLRGEWWKFYTKGAAPGHGLTVLASTGWDTTVPGLASVNTPRMRALVDDAARLADADGLSAEGRARLLAATLTHSMSDEDARGFMRTTLEGGDAQRAAFGLSRAQAPADADSAAGLRRWAHELGAARTNVAEWARRETVTGDARLAARVLTVAAEQGCVEGPQPDLVLGRDIVAAFPQHRPGPWTGQVQRAARQAQVEGLFADRDGALAWLAQQPAPV